MANNNRRIKDLTSLATAGVSMSSATEIAVDLTGYGEVYKTSMNDIVAYASGGTSGTSGTSGIDGEVTGVTFDTDLYYESDILYTPQITMTGTTDFSIHPASYWGLYINSITGEVYSNSGATGGSGTDGTSGIDGTSGTSGIAGTNGIDGADGTNGIDGTFTGATTDTDFYYDVTIDTLYVPNIKISSGATIGGDVSYTQFNESGEIRLYSGATQWDDLRVPVLSTKEGSSKQPDWDQFKNNMSGSRGVFTYYFSPTTEEELYFTTQLPHGWAQGTDIEAHVHWSPDIAGATISEKVSWGLEYTWSNVGGDFSDTTIIYGNDPFPLETLVADRHYVTELGDIVATSKDISSMLICRVFRDATGSGLTDNFLGDAGLFEIDFHYRIDSFGSNEEYIKY